MKKKTPVLKRVNQYTGYYTLKKSYNVNRKDESSLFMNDINSLIKADASAIVETDRSAITITVNCASKTSIPYAKAKELGFK